jgi:hypothetical protein
MMSPTQVGLDDRIYNLSTDNQIWTHRSAFIPKYESDPGGVGWKAQHTDRIRNLSIDNRISTHQSH